jgi:NADH dehydrogenase
MTSYCHHQGGGTAGVQASPLIGQLGVKTDRAGRAIVGWDRGNMAVVGKNFAILERGKLQMSGTLIWILWALIHVMFLPQVQNRLRVQMQWLWSYVTGQRSSRLIPEPRH